MESETPEAPIETKEDLEKQKLRLEIAELDRKWWKKPTYLAAALPTLLAILTIIYGFVTGYFQAEYRQLQSQKTSLEQDIVTIKAQKTELETYKANLEAENAKLYLEVANSKKDLAHLQYEIASSKYDESKCAIRIADLILQIQELKQGKVK